MLYNSSNSKHSPDKNRNVISVMKEVNNAFAEIHKKIEKQLDITQYEHASNYVNRYVAYTNIWNLKFKFNIESPEVALLQYLHLNYILNEQPPETFRREREAVETVYKLFIQYTPFSKEQIEARKLKMHAFIEQQQKDTH